MTKRAILFAGAILAFAPVKTFAQLQVQSKLFSEVDQAGAAIFGSANSAPTLVELIGNGIQIALSLLGVVLLGYVLYAGFLWMTAGGEEDNIKKAQGILRNAVIGLVIILASYSITLFVSRALESGGLIESQTTQQTP